MQIDANEFFRQATVRICSSLDIEIALKRMQSYVHRFIPARFISLVLFDPRKNVIRNIAGKISTTAEKMGPDVSLPDTREMRARWIQRHMNLEAYMLINSLEQDPDLLDLFTQMGLETEISFIMIRLELEGSRISGLWVSDVGKNRYSDDQAKLLQILKEPVAIAMSNALQHRQVLELNRELAEDIRNLREMVAQGSFREDLWFRLNVFPIWVPPLRERKEDIADLVDFFLHKKARELKLRQIPALDTNAIKPLLAHHWPGNVRELENLVERALIQSPGGPISFAGFFRKDTDFSPDLRVVEKPEKPLTLKDNGLFTKKCGKQIFRWSHQGEFIWLNGKTGPHSWPQNM
jgi:transcriptional regulator with GAF, ATPase, and Fis domain